MVDPIALWRERSSEMRAVVSSGVVFLSFGFLVIATSAFCRDDEACLRMKSTSSYRPGEIAKQLGYPSCRFWQEMEKKAFARLQYLRECSPEWEDEWQGTLKVLNGERLKHCH